MPCVFNLILFALSLMSLAVGAGPTDTELGVPDWTLVNTHFYNKEEQPSQLRERKAGFYDHVIIGELLTILLQPQAVHLNLHLLCNHPIQNALSQRDL